MAEISLREYLGELDRLIQVHAADEVILHSRHILSFYPKIVAAYRYLGRALVMNGRFDEAEAAFRRVLGVLPDDFHAHVGLSEIYDYKRRGDEAIWHLERALETQPNQRDLIDSMRSLYKRYRNIDNARIHLTAGAVARQAMNNRGFEQAIETLRTATQKYKDRGDLRVLLADALWKGGDPVEAAEVALDVLTMLPDCLVANRILTELWLQEDRPSDAQRYLNRVEAVEPYLAVELATGAVVDDDAFRIQALDVKRSAQTETAFNRPDWLQDINADSASAATPADDFVQWADSQSTLLGKAAEAPKPEQPLEPAFNETSFRVDTSSLVDSSVESDDLPDWMKDAMPAEDGSTGTMLSADRQQEDELPDPMSWLSQSGSLSEPDSFSTKEPDVAAADSWLSDYGGDFLADQPDDTPQPDDTALPDWMNAPDEVRPRRTSAAVPQEDQMPALDWLSGNDNLLDEALGLESLTSAADPFGSEISLGEEPSWMASEPDEDPITSMIPTDPATTQVSKPSGLADHASPKATFGFDTSELNAFESAEENAEDDNWLDQVSKEPPIASSPMRGLTSLLQEGNFDWMNQAGAGGSKSESIGDSLSDDFLGQFESSAKIESTDSPEWLAALSDDAPVTPTMPVAAPVSTQAEPEFEEAEPDFGSDLDFPDLDAFTTETPVAPMASVNDELAWDSLSIIEPDEAVEDVDAAAASDWLSALGAPASPAEPASIRLDDDKMNALFGDMGEESGETASEAEFTPIETGEAEAVAWEASEAATLAGIDISSMFGTDEDEAEAAEPVAPRSFIAADTHELDDDGPIYEWMQPADEPTTALDVTPLQMPGATGQSSHGETPIDPGTVDITLDWVAQEEADAAAVVAAKDAATKLEDSWDIASLGILDDSLTGPLDAETQPEADAEDAPDFESMFAGLSASEQDSPTTEFSLESLLQSDDVPEPALEDLLWESNSEAAQMTEAPEGEPDDTRATTEERAASLQTPDELDWLSDIQTEVQAAAIPLEEDEAEDAPASEPDLDALFAEGAPVTTGELRDIFGVDNVPSAASSAGVDELEALFAQQDEQSAEPVTLTEDEELAALFAEEDIAEEDQVPVPAAHDDLEALFAEQDEQPAEPVTLTEDEELAALFAEADIAEEDQAPVPAAHDDLEALFAQQEEQPAEPVALTEDEELAALFAAEGLSEEELAALFAPEGTDEQESPIPAAHDDLEALFASAEAEDQPTAELDEKVAQSDENRLDSLNMGTNETDSTLDALDAAIARTEDAVTWWNTNADDESPKPSQADDSLPVSDTAAGEQPEDAASEADLLDFEGESSPFDAQEESDLLSAVREPAPLDTTAIESMAMLEALPVPGHTAAIEALFPSEDAEPSDNLDLDALFGEAEVLSDEVPPLVPSQSQLLNVIAQTDETAGADTEPADLDAEDDAVAQAEDAWPPHIETPAAVADEADILPFGESVADLVLDEEPSEDQPADDSDALGLVNGEFLLEELQDEDDGLQFLEPDDHEPVGTLDSYELPADEVQDDDDWLDSEDDELPETPPVIEEAVASSEFDSPAGDPFSTGALASVESESGMAEAEPEVVEEEASDRIPDWLNAMAPGLDVDYEAEEDAPIEQEYLTDTPVSASQEFESGFRWVEDIVGEESQQVPVIEQAAEGDLGDASGSTEKPRFQFTRQPAWLKFTRKPAWMKKQSASDSESAAPADGDSDLPEWLR
ncbi:MAG: tetratricopeptide repeat protein [Pleurocapsa minor GSE-CHR-MK-17-07R]|jgi:Flp pilus assembly protein TadD|nr:tetratricopeptide repeat protein [Pleurocapsa minor GSE-CHR-MK 17-07R]